MLRDDGIFCVNIGDSFAGSHMTGGGDWRGWPKSLTGRETTTGTGLKPKDLMGIPWRLAFALQADGWYLRSRMPGGVEDGSQIELRPDVIWSKNAMPESVRDRPSVDFEDVFIFSKSKRYCWDEMAAKVATSGTAHSRGSGDYPKPDPSNGICKLPREPIPMRNMRASWRINTEPTSEQHYAAWPRDLVRRLISIGTSDKGCCPECGAQWGRVPGDSITTGQRSSRRDHGHLSPQGYARNEGSRCGDRWATAGTWSPTCSCEAGDPVPCSVLDPFSGIGRSGEVCYELGRRYMPAEISIGYAAIQARRLADHRTVSRGEALRPVRPATITGPLFP